MATGGGGILLANMASAIVRDVIMVGVTPGTQPDFGIRVWEGDTCFIGPNVNIVAHGSGLLVDPAGVSTFAMYITGAMFDSAGMNSAGAICSGLDVQPRAAGFVYDIAASNSWFGNSSDGHGVCMISGDGTIDGASFTGCQFVHNGYAGVYANGADLKNWSITGGLASGNTAVAVDAQLATSRFTVTGLRAGPTGVHGPNGLGVRIGAFTSNYYEITGNNLVGNTGAGLTDSGSGADKVIANNLT